MTLVFITMGVTKGQFTYFSINRLDMHANNLAITTQLDPVIILPGLKEDFMQAFVFIFLLATLMTLVASIVIQGPNLKIAPKTMIYIRMEENVEGVNEVASSKTG